jgi:hypothetical protein
MIPQLREAARVVSLASLHALLPWASGPVPDVFETIGELARSWEKGLVASVGLATRAQRPATTINIEYVARRLRVPMLAAMARTKIGSTMLRGLSAAVVLAATLAGQGRGLTGAEVASSSAAAATRSSPAPASTPGLKLVKPTERTGIVPGTVIAVLSGTSVTGEYLRRSSELRAPRTSDAVVNTVLSGLGATSIEPLFGRLPAATTRALTRAARGQIGARALNLADIVVIHLAKAGAAAAARKLAATSGISFAEPDRYVQTMDTGGQVLATGATASKPMGTDLSVVTPGPSLLPTNYGFRSSLESYLNAQGVDAAGAFATLQEKYRQLPGTGERITNVSVGDLTDASMHDAEVATYGPTTVRAALP